MPDRCARAPAPPLIRSIRTAAGGQGAVGPGQGRSAAGGWRLPRGRGRMGEPANGFTCDAPGPAVELHRVVERRGHHVQDTARLRVQEPHRGREREPAAAGGESEDPRGRADREGDGRGSERQLGTSPPAVARLRVLLLLLRAPRRRGCCGGGGGDEPGEGAGTVKAQEEEEEFLLRAPSTAPLYRLAPPPLQSPWLRSRGRARGGGAPPPARAPGLLRGDAVVGDAQARVVPAPLPSRPSLPPFLASTPVLLPRLPPRHQALRRSTPPSHG